MWTSLQKAMQHTLVLVYIVLVNGNVKRLSIWRMGNWLLVYKRLLVFIIQFYHASRGCLWCITSQAIKCEPWSCRNCEITVTNYHSTWKHSKMKIRVAKKKFFKIFAILLTILILPVLILFLVVIGRTFTFNLNTELEQWENTTTFNPHLSQEQKARLLANLKGKTENNIFVTGLFAYRFK